MRSGLPGSLKTKSCKCSEIPSGTTQISISDFKQKVDKNIGALHPARCKGPVVSLTTETQSFP